MLVEHSLPGEATVQFSSLVTIVLANTAFGPNLVSLSSFNRSAADFTVTEYVTVAVSVPDPAAPRLPLHVTFGSV